MPTSYKVLGQTAPIANTETLHYSVPSLTSTIIKSINITNTSTSVDTFSIALVPTAAIPAANLNYIVYNNTIAGNTTITLKSGFALTNPNGIRVSSTNGTSTFTTFGSEIS